MPFIPLDLAPLAAMRRGFVPLDDTGEQESRPPAVSGAATLKNVALNNPLTAIGEAGLNLASQGVALPVAGLFGLYEAAGKALGIHDRDPADVIGHIANDMTYEPRGSMGKATAAVAMYPFEKLAEVGRAAGDKTLSTTHSPVLATAVDTIINAAPMLLTPLKKAGREITARIAEHSRAATAGQHDVPAPTAATEHPPAPIEQGPAVPAQLERQAPEPRAQQSALPGEEQRQQPAPVAAEQQRRSGFIPLDEEPRAAEPLSAERQPGAAVEEAPPATSQAMKAEREPLRGLAPLEEDAPAPMEPPLNVERAPDAPAEEAPLTTTQTAKAEAPPRSGFIPLDEEAPTMKAAAAEAPSVERAPSAMATTEDLAQRQAMQPGMNYAPLVNDATYPTTAAKGPRAEPLRREDVLAPLVKALGTTIYEGRVKGKNTLGLYTPGKETVRIKRASDIEVASHEIAHLLDDRIPEIKQAWHADKELAKELKGVSYDKTKTNEGFAEFVRLYMTQPEEALTRAPKFSTWFDDFVNRHKYGPAIKKAQADMTAWFGQDAIDRARSKIGDQKNFNDAFDGFWDKFRQSTVDDLHGVYRMERDLKGEVKPAGAYETARLSRASHSIAEGTINFGHPVRLADGSIRLKGQGLRQILEPVAGHLDNALLYFVGRSAHELMMQQREHLFTKTEIKAMLALETPEAKQAFKDYQAWNKGILDFAESSGVINPAARSMWQRQNYMPFHRVGQPGEWKGGKSGDWSGIKALTGGTENLRDILGNMVGNAALLIEKSVKNEARQKIAAMAESDRGAGRFMTQIDKESRPVRIDSAQVLDALLKTLGIDKRDPAAADMVKRLREQIEANPTSFEFFIHDQAPAGGNVVAVLHGGKPTYYEVADPVLLRALQAIDRPTQSWLVKWLGLPKRVGQMTVTLTPDFMVANIARDTLMGSIMSRAGFRPVMDSLEGMRLRLTHDPLYQDYIANGGGLSSIYLDHDKLRVRLEKFYRNQGIDYHTVLDAPEKLLGFMETLADAFETSTRLGEFKRAVEGGQHPRHAAYLAREVSTDFAMRGDNPALNFMYDTVMFLKPAVLSIDRLFRGLAHDPNRGAVATKAGMVALFSMALHALNNDNPRYQDLPDWDRDTHWHFFVGEQHFRFPKLWEVGAMASVAERAVEKLTAGDPAGLGKDFLRILGSTFGLQLMPQILAPIYEQAANRNNFTNAPIETPGMENEQPFLRAKPTTSETLKALGMATRKLPESAQVNPVRAEALLRGYFNTWALYGLALSDHAFFGEKLPAGRTDQLPVVRRFYAQEPPHATKYESIFYDMLGEAQRLQGTLRSLDRMGSKDIADEVEKSPLAGEANPLGHANHELRGINGDMRAVRRDSSFSPDEKRQKLDALTVERNALLKAVVMDARAAQGKAKQGSDD